MTLDASQTALASNSLYPRLITAVIACCVAFRRRYHHCLHSQIFYRLTHLTRAPPSCRHRRRRRCYHHHHHHHHCRRRHLMLFVAWIVRTFAMSNITHNKAMQKAITSHDMTTQQTWPAQSITRGGPGTNIAPHCVDDQTVGNAQHRAHFVLERETPHRQYIHVVFQEIAASSGVMQALS